MRSEILWAARYGSLFATHQSTKQLNFVAAGCLTLLLLKCPFSHACQLCSAKWCYVSYFQRLEICMQIRSVNFREFTRTWFATRVFIFRPPETLLCVAGRSFFQNLGSQGTGRPGGNSRAAPSTFFAACSEASGGFNCVSKVLLKSQCKKYGIWKGKIKPHLGKVCIFLPTLFYKNHRNIMLWWKSG